MQNGKMYLECKFMSMLLLMLLGILKEIECLNFCFNASLEDVIWDGCSEYESNILEGVQYEAARIVTGAIKGTSKEFRLNDTVLQTKNVSSKIQCILTCVQDPCCRSLNYRARSQCEEQSGCELLHNNVHNTSKELERNSSYDHVFLNEPMKEYNAKCFPNESCAEIYKSGERQDGIYIIDPDGLGSFQVKCLMTLGSGGWTVIQRRQNGSEDFYRNWTDYKNGFGNLSGEFWLGLDKIHRLTNSGQNVLRINMTAKNNDQFYAEYEKFFVSDESEQYKLDVGGYSGNNYDSMAYHNGYKFYTKDKDNDDKCANTKKGGWWYRRCAAANPNGPYEENGLYWEKTLEKAGSTKEKLYPKTFQMVIRPRPETYSKPSPPSNFNTG